MGRRNGLYAGNPAKYGFPVHKQERDTSCGPACLRMLAEWATGQPQSEYHWRQLSGWSANVGLPGEKMRQALVSIGNLRSPRVTAKQVRDWHQAVALPTVTDSSVYLLRTDSYGYDGQNLWHWIVLLDIFPSADKEQDGSPRHRLALYADTVDGQLIVWPWKSLVASKVLDGFHVSMAVSGGPNS